MQNKIFRLLEETSHPSHAIILYLSVWLQANNDKGTKIL